MVFSGPNHELEQRSRPSPNLQAGETLVEIVCCTLCGSDLHSFSGRRSCPTPTVLGHEMIGRIVEIAADGNISDISGNPLHVGDKVTWSIAASCGKCFNCTHDIPQKCETLFKYGHEQIDENKLLSGGLATHCRLVPGTGIVKIPDNVPDEVMSPANCATATVAGAFRLAGNIQGESVLIMGAGMLGLTAAAMSRHQQAKTVIVADVDKQRLRLAEQFGATHIIDASDDVGSFLKEVQSRTSGRGASVAIEVTGNPHATQTLLQTLRIGGQAVLLGAVYPSQPVELDAEFVVRRLLRISGLHNYHPGDLEAAVQFLTAIHTEYPFASLVEKQYSLNDANQAFADAIETHPFRVMVRP